MQQFFTYRLSEIMGSSIGSSITMFVATRRNLGSVVEFLLHYLVKLAPRLNGQLVLQIQQMIFAVERYILGSTTMALGDLRILLT